MKYWDIVFKSEWIVGLVGSLILIGMLTPFEILNKSSTLNQLSFGILIGTIATMIAFGMSLNNTNGKVEK